MKELLLIRHAEAVPFSPLSLTQRSDFDRPLTPTGCQRATDLGVYMAQRQLIPEIIFCSPAVRTKQTLEHMRPHFSLRTSIIYSPTLYDSSLQNLWDHLVQIEDQYQRVCLLSHNPGLEDLVDRLLNLEQDRTKVIPFEPAALAFIEMDLKSWRELKEGTGILKEAYPSSYPFTERAKG